jgi:hypothetical protein
MEEIKVSKKHKMDPVILSARVFVGVIAALAGSLTGLVGFGIWMGSSSAVLQAHTSEIAAQKADLDQAKEKWTTSLTAAVKEIGNISERTARTEVMMELIFPDVARRVPKRPPPNP